MQIHYTTNQIWDWWEMKEHGFLTCPKFFKAWWTKKPKQIITVITVATAQVGVSSKDFPSLPTGSPSSISVFLFSILKRWTLEHWIYWGMNRDGTGFCSINGERFDGGVSVVAWIETVPAEVKLRTHAWVVELVYKIVQRVGPQQPRSSSPLGIHLESATWLCLFICNIFWGRGFRFWSFQCVYDDMIKREEDGNRNLDRILCTDAT